MFDPSRGATTPKARFAYLFPTDKAAVIQVRLKPNLTEHQRRRAIELVREAVAMKQWQLKNGASYTVTGAPVLVEDLAAALTDSLLRLLVVAILVMAIVLALVFRSRLRLLPLAVALAAVAITFGLMSLLGASLTMASIAVLPVLLGLGVDYAIQYQARVEEEDGDALRTARIAVPTIATAALATSVGFLVLLLSPVPMVRGFGVLLVVGIAIAFFLALSAGTAALAATARRRGGGGQLGASARGAAELVDELGARVWRLLAPLRRLGGRVREATLRGAFERPKRVLLIGLVLALAGLALDSQTQRQLRPARAGAAGSAQRARPRRAAEGDRRGGRDRRRRAEQGPDRPEGGRVDARLPVRGAQALPLLGQERLRQGRHLPGAVAAPTCSRPPARPRRRRASAGCWTPCRPTSRRR